MSKKAWSGRFSQKESPLMERFNASIFFDRELYPYDIQGSIEHAKMLSSIGILNKTELKKMVSGLNQVKKEIDSGDFAFKYEQEDIHMAIEGRLNEIIGPIAGKLHSARSRNDQVALDIKLCVRDKTQLILNLLKKLQKSFVDLAEKNLTSILPGYTHLQRAQPVSLAHHLLAYYEMLLRDGSRFQDNLERLKECPLGAGALAGSPIAIDRKMTAKGLGFKEPTRNSLDTVADRDFVLDFISASSILMMHLSRLSEELILWNSQEFQFVILPEQFCTGSSMMPQKINPDAPELIRGKTARVYGNLMSLLTLMKGLPLAYNKDMQEDKEPLFDTMNTVEICLEVLCAMVPKLKFNKEKMYNATKEGFVLATDVADYLARNNLPFREAHEVVGRLVQHCIEEKCGLEDLSLEKLQSFSKVFKKDILEILNVKYSVNSRVSFGGTALKNVKKQIVKARKKVK